MRQRDFSSGVIGWFGAGFWSHAASVLPDGQILDSRSDRVYDFRAKKFVDPGVQIRPACYMDSMQWMQVTIECGQRSASDYYEALDSQLRKPYDKPGIIDFLTGGKDRNWRDQSAWFCSELVAWALEQAGICPKLTVPVYKITPGEIAILAIALGGEVTQRYGLA